MRSDAAGAGCIGGLLRVLLIVGTVEPVEDGRKGSCGTGGGGGEDAARSPAANIAADMDEVSNLRSSTPESDVVGRCMGALVVLLLEAMTRPDSLLGVMLLASEVECFC